MYLFIEMFTIIDAVLGTWRPLTITLQREALKIWFYALAVGVVLDLYQLAFVDSTTPSTAPSGGSEGGKKNVTRAAAVREKGEGDGLTRAEDVPPSPAPRDGARRALYRQLVIDSCDLLIPGATVGWLGLDPVTVGVAGSISAFLGGSNAWARVNA
jgi:hypothetical protein